MEGPRRPVARPSRRARVAGRAGEASEEPWRWRRRGAWESDGVAGEEDCDDIAREMSGEEREGESDGGA